MVHQRERAPVHVEVDGATDDVQVGSSSREKHLNVQEQLVFCVLSMRCVSLELCGEVSCDIQTTVQRSHCFNRAVFSFVTFDAVYVQASGCSTGMRGRVSETSNCCPYFANGRPELAAFFVWLCGGKHFLSDGSCWIRYTMHDTNRGLSHHPRQPAKNTTKRTLVEQRPKRVLTGHANSD